MPDTDDISLWNAAAEQYDADIASGSNWRQQHVLWPILFELLGDVEAQDILDAGCGPGLLSTEVAKRGACVTGIDGTEQMLAFARKHATDSSHNIQFIQADLCAPLPLNNKSFDGILCNMVLMNIPTIHLVITEFCRLLRPTGRLVFSITHPSFFMWFWTRDTNGNKLYKPVDDYLTIRSDMNEFWGPTRHYHRPLSWYTESLVSAGFVIDRLLEPTPDFQRCPENDHVWRIPDFVVIRASPKPSR